MSDFVDPRFLDLLTSRLNETEEHLKETLIFGSVENHDVYNLLRGRIEGLALARRDIKDIVDQVMVEE
tara:strand:- start:2482 stop:2685 length:204 start_codon:yes stop_codon:yes gene_type:complete